MLALHIQWLKHPGELVFQSRQVVAVLSGCPASSAYIKGGTRITVQLNIGCESCIFVCSYTSCTERHINHKNLAK